MTASEEMMETQAVITLARQELKISVRSKWTLIFAGVFGALTLAISYFGLATAGTVGFQGFLRTAASLLNLVLYLIPMVALSMGALSLTGEKGASELLFSQPVTRTEILLGKILGLFLSLAAATLFGFGLAGLIVSAHAGPDGVSRFLAVAGLSLLLALIFLSLGAMAGVLGRTRTRALAFSVFLWFFFVLFYDLLVIGLAFLFRERTANLFLFLSLFGNPVDLVRVSSLIALSDTPVFGAAGAALVKFLGGKAAGSLAVLSALLLWIAGPLFIADRALRKQDV